MDTFTNKPKKNRNTPCRRRRNALRAFLYRHKQLAICEVGTQTETPMNEDPPQEKLAYPEREVIAVDNSVLLNDSITPDDETSQKATTSIAKGPRFKFSSLHNGLSSKSNKQNKKEVIKSPTIPPTKPGNKLDTCDPAPSAHANITPNSPPKPDNDT